MGFLPAFSSLTKTKAMVGLVLLTKSLGKEIRAGQKYDASYEDVRDLLNCRDDQHLEQELNTMPRSIPASRLIPDEKGYIGLVTTCHWGKSGRVHWEFSSDFVNTILSRDRGYRTVSWEVLVAFNSTYAAKIYLYLCPYIGGGKQIQPPSLTTAELRELLGVPPEAYPSHASGRLKAEIQRAVRAVNAAADCFTVAYHKEGRDRGHEAARHYFLWSPKMKQELLALHTAARETPPQERSIEERNKDMYRDLPNETKQRVIAYVLTHADYFRPGSGFPSSPWQKSAPTEGQILSDDFFWRFAATYVEDAQKYYERSLSPSIGS